jgi:hypothetical protein
MEIIEAKTDFNNFKGETLLNYLNELNKENTIWLSDHMEPRCLDAQDISECAKENKWEIYTEDPSITNLPVEFNLGMKEVYLKWPDSICPAHVHVPSANHNGQWAFFSLLAIETFLKFGWTIHLYQIY